MKILTGAQRAKGMVSDQELIEAKGKEEEARRRVFDEMREDVLAAGKLGMPPIEIRKTLKNAGVAQDDINDLLSGRYRPGKASLQKGPDQTEARRRLSVVR
jgi:hypothetical protein